MAEVFYRTGVYERRLEHRGSLKTVEMAMNGGQVCTSLGPHFTGVGSNGSKVTIFLFSVRLAGTEGCLVRAGTGADR